MTAVLHPCNFPMLVLHASAPFAAPLEASGVHMKAWG